MRAAINQTVGSSRKSHVINLVKNSALTNLLLILPPIKRCPEGCAKTTIAINLAACLGRKEWACCSSTWMCRLMPRGFGVTGNGAPADPGEDVALEAPDDAVTMIHRPGRGVFGEPFWRHHLRSCLLATRPGLHDVLACSAALAEAVFCDVADNGRSHPCAASLAGVEPLLAAAANREKKLADMLAAWTDHYDYVSLDCPPAQGLLAINALCAADYVLVPSGTQSVRCRWGGAAAGYGDGTGRSLRHNDQSQFAAEHGGSAVSSRPAAVGELRG